MYDAIIIGCGITGAAVAFELSKYHLQVAVLERENDVACGATRANSAILHAGYDPHPDTLMARLNVRGTALAKERCAQLDVPCAEIGSLVVGFSVADEDTLRTLYGQGIKNGVTDLALLDGDAARALEPTLSPTVTCALHAPSAAICSPWELCLALAETAVLNGVELFLEHTVSAVEKIQDSWRVTTDKGCMEGRVVLNAAGVCADLIHDLAAPHAFTVLPSRGQYHLLDKCEGTRVSHIIFPCPSPAGKGVLVAPTVHGNLIVGPTAEPVTGEDSSITKAGLDRIVQSAQASVPSIDFRQSIRSFAGVRARTDGDDFILKEADGAPAFFDLAGICSPGLSAACAMGEYAAALLSDSYLILKKKEHFICTRKRTRFHLLSPEGRAALVAENPAYGRVICRCEMVTEGEILATLTTPIPPRSVDGVKRRVGAGMGRCQGGFCAPRVVELLSAALGVPPEHIPQDRVGSWLLAGETKGGAPHV